MELLVISGGKEEIVLEGAIAMVMVLDIARILFVIGSHYTFS